MIIKTNQIKKNKKVDKNEEKNSIKAEADRWMELKQTNCLDSPGKDLLIPHISRDEGEQMFLGHQVT